MSADCSSSTLLSSCPLLVTPHNYFGNSHSRFGTPRMTHNSALEGTKILVDDERDTSSPELTMDDILNRLWPFSRRISCRMVLYTVLTGLLLASVVLMIYTVSLSVSHSDSIQALSEQLASQEESIRQLRITSSRLLKKLNISYPLGHT